MGHSRTGHRPRRIRSLGTWLASALLIGMQLAVPVAQAAPISSAAAPAAVPAAPTSTVTLAVQAARTEPLADIGPVTIGQDVTAYKFMINLDNTGETVTRNADAGPDCSAWLDAAHTTPNPAYPGSCKWTSIAGLASSAPVAAQG